MPTPEGCEQGKKLGHNVTVLHKNIFWKRHKRGIVLLGLSGKVWERGGRAGAGLQHLRQGIRAVHVPRTSVNITFTPKKLHAAQNQYTRHSLRYGARGAHGSVGTKKAGEYREQQNKKVNVIQLRDRRKMDACTSNGRPVTKRNRSSTLVAEFLRFPKASRPQTVRL